MTGVGDTTGVGVNVVVLTGVGLVFAAVFSAPAQAAVGPLAGTVTQMVSVTMSVV